MAICKCKICGSTISDGISCLPVPYIIGGEAYDPIPYGQECPWSGFPPEECRDCGAPLGGVHHTGCCVERCPACDGQILWCPCFDKALCEHGGPRAARCHSHLLRRAGGP